MSKKPKPPKVVWCAVNRRGGIVGIGRQRKLAIFGAELRASDDWAKMQSDGYTVHKYILEEPCQKQ